MNNSKRTGAIVCFGISIGAIVAMFMTAAVIKGNRWSTIAWIVEYFWQGYFLFILGSITFAVIGCQMMKEWKKGWVVANDTPSDARIAYNGYNADVYVYDDKVVIIGKGYNKGIGEKSIPMASISAVQFVPSNGMTNGYLTFNVLGEVASSRGGIGSGYHARQSENTVIVKTPADDNVLRKIKNFVDQAKVNASHSNSATIIQQTASPAEELKKMKELLDMGILTQEEFDAKKKQLLGLPNTYSVPTVPQNIGKCVVCGRENIPVENIEVVVAGMSRKRTMCAECAGKYK